MLRLEKKIENIEIDSNFYSNSKKNNNNEISMKNFDDDKMNFKSSESVRSGFNNSFLKTECVMKKKNMKLNLETYNDRHRNIFCKTYKTCSQDRIIPKSRILRFGSWSAHFLNCFVLSKCVTWSLFSLFIFFLVSPTAATGKKNCYTFFF